MADVLGKKAVEKKGDGGNKKQSLRPESPGYAAAYRPS
jgi:hypothetical protein